MAFTKADCDAAHNGLRRDGSSCYSEVMAFLFFV